MANYSTNYIISHSELYRQLNALKKKLSSPEYDSFFRRSKRKINYNDYYSIIEDIDRDSHLTTGPLTHCTGKLLDLCCAPGAFSCYFLTKLPMTGTGITLATEEGGEDFVLDTSKRYRIIYHNINTVDTKELGLADDFDLVICGGTYINQKGRCSYSEAMKYQQQLTLNQFRVAFEVLRPGGTIVTKINSTPTLANLFFLHVLYTLFESVELVKPKHYSDKSFCFCVGKGWKGSPNPEPHIYIAGVKVDLPSLTVIDRIKVALSILGDAAESTELSLDNIYRLQDDELLELIPILEPVWDSQYKSLLQLIER